MSFTAIAKSSVASATHYAAVVNIFMVADAVEAVERPERDCLKNEVLRP